MQPLNEIAFGTRGPGNGHQREKERKGKVAEPSTTSGIIDHEDRDQHSLTHKIIIQESPIGIGLLDYTERKSQKCEDNDKDRQENGGDGNVRRWSSAPSAPPKEKGQKRNEPAVLVLGIDRPFQIRLTNGQGPDREEKKPRQKPSSRRPRELVGDFRFLKTLKYIQRVSSKKLPCLRGRADGNFGTTSDDRDARLFRE